MGALRGGHLRRHQGVCGGDRESWESGQEPGARHRPQGAGYREASVWKLLLRRSRWPGDLRAVSAALRMISDMEAHRGSGHPVLLRSPGICGESSILRQVPMGGGEMALAAIKMK